MKAVRLVSLNEPLRDAVVAAPKLGSTDVLIAIKATGICHSDQHYRSGVLSTGPLPITLGHEVSGVIEDVGAGVTRLRRGQRVVVHYLAFCGECRFCRSGNEQFCAEAQMIGKHRDGGYAERMVMPEASVVVLPDEIPFAHGAVMMCSTMTSFHALRKARVRPGETVAVFGAGGLGMSALQLAPLMGAGRVFGVDIQKGKLDLARELGAMPVDAKDGDPAAAIKDLTEGEGVDVALELTGLPAPTKQSIRSLAPMGRAVMVGVGGTSVDIDIFRDVVAREAEIIGCSDHLLAEIPTVLEYARTGKLDYSHIVTKTVPLEARAITAVLDALDAFDSDVRSVIVPE
jgi:D-arabinose 1-dehydrogenase-like Zn-dependent alcohol dehydrogenase